MADPVADPVTEPVADPVTDPVAGRGARPVAREVRMYALLAWTWIRAAAQYPVSLVLMVLATACITGLDAAAILLLFAHADRVAGFGAEEVLFLYGTSALSFALSDCVLGTADRLGQHVRDGTLDAMLVRPVSPLVQVAAEEFTPRRAGKLVPAGLVLLFVLPRLETDWTPGRVAMLPVMVAAGAAIFAGLWVMVGAAQFFLVESQGATKSVTYGGAFLTQYPPTMFARDLVRGVTFVVPLAFVNWQPALYVLDRPDPLGLPEAVRFASPAVAVAVCAAAAVTWRAGLRYYRSTGS